MLEMTAPEPARFYSHATGPTAAAPAARLPGGEVRAGVRAEALLGAMIYRILTRRPLTERYVDDLLDVIIRP